MIDCHIVVHHRLEGQLVPEGVSLTLTYSAWYVRIRHGDSIARIRIPHADKKNYTLEEKRVYNAPHLIVYGDIRYMTETSHMGMHSDHSHVKGARKTA